MVPCGSRTMPCVLAASPSDFGTRYILVSPVLASTRPMVVFLLGTFEVNHRLPSRSAQESCTSEPMRDGVPSDQSLPSEILNWPGKPPSCWIGTSYSLMTTRAVSPDGRGRSFIFIELSP